MAVPVFVPKTGSGTTPIRHNRIMDEEQRGTEDRGNEVSARWCPFQTATCGFEDLLETTSQQPSFGSRDRRFPRRRWLGRERQSIGGTIVVDRH